MRKQKENTLSRQEIEELMRLRGWSRTRLAVEMDVTENCVSRWIIGQPTVSGPAAILLRLWLEQARLDSAKRKAVAV